MRDSPCIPCPTEIWSYWLRKPYSNTSRRISAARLVATLEAEEAEVPIGGGQGASRHIEEHGQSGKYKEAEEMHREALAVMERAVRVNGIFAIGYGKRLSTQRPPDPLKS